MVGFSQVLKDTSIIVSGFPRSGTTTMMRMMYLGGFDILASKRSQEKQDEFSPYGVFELDFVKDEIRKNDPEWLSGKVLKLVSPYIRHLPKRDNYKVIFMLRDENEIISSLLAMRTIWEDVPSECNAWALEFLKRHNIPVLKIQYREMVQYPKTTAMQIGDFLEVEVDFDAMAKAVDRNPRKRVKNVRFKEGEEPLVMFEGKLAKLATT